MKGIEAAATGICGSEPELKTSRAGKSYCVFSLGTDAGQDDEGKDKLEWVRCTAFNDTAEAMAASLRKGDKVHVLGSLRLDRWTKDGEQRFGLSMACSKVDFVGASALGKNRPRREPKEAHESPDFGPRTGGRRDPKGVAIPATTAKPEPPYKATGTGGVPAASAAIRNKGSPAYRAWPDPEVERVERPRPKVVGRDDFSYEFEDKLPF